MIIEITSKSILIIFSYSRDDQKKEYKQPLYFERDKKLKIDKEMKTVYTENRNIQTNPPKYGTAAYPG